MSDAEIDDIVKLLHASEWTIGYDDRLRAARAIRELQPYKAELLKIAEQVGESKDPFAAWESIRRADEK